MNLPLLPGTLCIAVSALLLLGIFRSPSHGSAGGANFPGTVPVSGGMLSFPSCSAPRDIDRSFDGGSGIDDVESALAVKSNGRVQGLTAMLRKATPMKNNVLSKGPPNGTPAGVLTLVALFACAPGGSSTPSGLRGPTLAAGLTMPACMMYDNKTAPVVIGRANMGHLISILLP